MSNLFDSYASGSKALEIKSYDFTTGTLEMSLRVSFGTAEFIRKLCQEYSDTMFCIQGNKEISGGNQ